MRCLYRFSADGRLTALLLAISIAALVCGLGGRALGLWP